MRGGRRGKPAKLSLALRNVTQRLHIVSEERFHTVAAIAPGQVAHHLEVLTVTLIAWHRHCTAEHGDDGAPDALGQALADHVAALGLPSRQPPPELQRFGLAGRGEAIGSAYVLCGAALGLRSALGAADLTIKAERARAMTLLQAGKAMSGRWRAVRMAIDRWGGEHPDMQVDVMAGACTAFCAALTILDAMAEQAIPLEAAHV